MTVYGRIRGVDGTSREASADGASYVDARTRLENQVGDGEQILSIATWPV